MGCFGPTLLSLVRHHVTAQGNEQKDNFKSRRERELLEMPGSKEKSVFIWPAGTAEHG
jgi:hypothetical protein